MFRAPRLYSYLDAVARAGSIRKAAARLGIASTSLNRKILEIEAELGAGIFERLPKGVRMTAAGEVLIAAIRRNLNDIDSANAQIEQLRGLVRGNVQLAAAESAAGDLVPAAITRYQTHHPRVHFELTVGGTAKLITALLADEVELALVHDPPQNDQIKTLFATPQPLCALVPAGHPLAGRSWLRLADCQPHPVALGDRSFGSRRLIEATARRSRLKLNMLLEANTVGALKAYCQRAGVIYFQFQIGTITEAQSGEFAAIPLIDTELAGGKLALVTRAGRNLSLPALSFAEALKQEMGRL